jgi:hypothetical protein
VASKALKKEGCGLTALADAMHAMVSVPPNDSREILANWYCVFVLGVYPPLSTSSSWDYIGSPPEKRDANPNKLELINASPFSLMWIQARVRQMGVRKAEAKAKVSQATIAIPIAARNAQSTEQVSDSIATSDAPEVM